ncbi:hypothetical protein BX666DRAFT_2119033 [Dichotomocladium elegans]|nr:hypothetical protein BX666DRAFT_2119033 [Dichotomocladium elegans]
MQQLYQSDIYTLSSPASSHLIDYQSSISLPAHDEALDTVPPAIDFTSPLEHISSGLSGSSSGSGAVISTKNRSHKYINDEEKRKKFLERNRQAAVKSRQRKKQLLTDLQAKTDYLTADNEKLQADICMLRDEIARLRELLHKHNECPVIKKHSLALMPLSPASSQQPQSQEDSDYSLHYNGHLRHEPSIIGMAPARFSPSSQSQSKLIKSRSLMPFMEQQEATMVHSWY